jgi:heme exporter protein CcmD
MLDLDASPYGFFVWTSYGLTALVFVGLIWASLAHSRYWRKRAEQSDDTSK